MDALNHGMKLRFSYPPYPLVGRPREVLRRYVAGNDAITGKPIMPQVIDALTQPLTEEEKNPKASRGAPRPRLLQPDTEENLLRLFLENGWTDGAPIVLPTEERVAHMLTGTAAAAEEVVGQMTITIDQQRLEYTVEKVAVNAVMAGAGPQHLPVILAIAAGQEPSMPSSTTSFGRMAVVNGPIREEIDMNSGLGALSPFNHANTVIGRTWTLMTINLADSRIGETFMGSTGNNMNYNNMFFAENEDRSVWEPFHVRKGFKKEESTVSFFQGWSAINSMGAAGCRRPAQEETLIMMQAFPCIRSSLTLVMDPLVAKHLEEQGFESPEQLSRYLSDNFEMTVGQYWGSDVVYSLVEPNARNGIEPFASWLKLPEDEPIKPYTMPENINVVVVGGET
ncbi:MAG: UGSC family (seleno)protein, partial [Acidobacteriota bacterium]